MKKRMVLKLFLTGTTPRTQTILRKLEEILDVSYKGVYSIKVIDVIKNPQLAENDKILATPTLIKVLPPPVARLIGNLSNKERVLLGLDLVVI